MQLSFFVLYAVSAFVFIKAAEEVLLPPEIRSCERESEHFSSCLRLALQEAWPTLIKGVPDLGIPPLDPFKTKSLETVYQSGDVRGNMSVINAMTYGMSKTRFLSVKPYFEGDLFNLNVDVEMPKIFIEGYYSGEGYLGAFKIGGKGNFNVSMEGIRTNFNIEGSNVNDRWVIKHFRALPEVTKMQVWFSDLFNGNEDLNKAVISFTNMYWPTLYRGMLPIVSDTWDRYLTEIANDVFSKISFSKLFP